MGLLFDGLPDWEFTVEEFSPDGWRLVAVRNGEPRGEGTGSDHDALIEEFKEWARGVDRDLSHRQQLDR